ncbi:hypothetical protein I4U23_000686 [Adineta vaga]|nr:hypothetical protein I4U23_000686 [Adineta vaga]
MSDKSLKKDYFSITSDLEIYYELRCSSSSSNTATKLIMIMDAYATLRLYDEDDAPKLINHVWTDQTVVHVSGVSLGGIVAQELAVLLIP